VCGSVGERLLDANLIAGSASAVLVRRSCLEKVGAFDETLVCAEDWDLWLRLAEHYAFDFVDEELVWLRQHPGNAQKNELRMLGGELLFLNKLYLTGKARRFHFERLSQRLAASGYDARRLQGYESCDWRVRILVTGLPRKILSGLSQVGVYALGLPKMPLKTFYRVYPHVPGFIRRPLKRIWQAVRPKATP